MSAHLHWWCGCHELYKQTLARITPRLAVWSCDGAKQLLRLITLDCSISRLIARGCVVSTMQVNGLRITAVARALCCTTVAIAMRAAGAMICVAAMAVCSGKQLMSVTKVTGVTASRTGTVCIRGTRTLPAVWLLQRLPSGNCATGIDVNFRTDIVQSMCTESGSA
jgi:hypothetical protein